MLLERLATLSFLSLFVGRSIEVSLFGEPLVEEVFEVVVLGLELLR